MPKALGILSYEARAESKIEYRPALAAPKRGFGPFEVHPQRLPVNNDGTLELRHNGDWLVVAEDGHFAFKPSTGGRESAERFAASCNGGLPTRVIDLTETECTSCHTRDSVQAELAARGVTL